MKTANTHTHPGRPAYKVKWPYGKFTFNQLCLANGVAIEGAKKGKGKDCTALTLRKALDRDMYHPFESGKNKGKPNKNSPNRKSLIVETDETRNPNSEKGLGRKAFVFIRREKLNGLKGAAKAKTSVKLDAPSSTAATLAEVHADIVAATKPVETAPVVVPEVPPTAPVEATETVTVTAETPVNA